MTGRAWTIPLTPGGPLLYVSDTTERAYTADIARSLSSAVLAGAADAGLPPLDRAHVTVEYRPPPARHPRPPGRGHAHAHTPELFTTAETVRPSADAAVAALADAGLLPINPTRPIKPAMSLGATTPGGQLVLHIREIS